MRAHHVSCCAQSSRYMFFMLISAAAAAVAERRRHCTRLCKMMRLMRNTFARTVLRYHLISEMWHHHHHHHRNKKYNIKRSPDHRKMYATFTIKSLFRINNCGRLAQPRNYYSSSSLMWCNKTMALITFTFAQYYRSHCATIISYLWMSAAAAGGTALRRLVFVIGARAIFDIICNNLYSNM